MWGFGIGIFSVHCVSTFLQGDLTYKVYGIFRVELKPMPPLAPRQPLISSNSLPLPLFIFLAAARLLRLLDPRSLLRPLQLLSTPHERAMSRLSSRQFIALVAILAAAIACTDAFTAVPSSPTRPLHSRRATSLAAASGTASGAQEAPKSPKTFREGEVMGLRLMQAGQYDEALKGERQWRVKVLNQQQNPANFDHLDCTKFVGIHNKTIKWT